MIRESEGVGHLAVIREFQKDPKKCVTGSIFFHPCYEIENERNSETQNNEELIRTKDLTHDILISDENSNLSH